MPISFETLKGFMPEIGLKKFQILSEATNEGNMLAGFSSDTGDSTHPQLQVGIVVSLQEDGEFVQLRIVKLVEKEEVQNSAYKNILMSYFLKKNFEKKIGRWCLDPEDGDVYIDWSIGIEDNDKLTLKQVSRMMNSLISSVKEAWIPIHNILEVGSEVKRSADDLKKEIALGLMKAKKFDVLEKLDTINDARVLADILSYIEYGKIDKAVELIRA